MFTLAAPPPPPFTYPNKCTQTNHQFLILWAFSLQLQSSTPTSKATVVENTRCLKHLNLPKNQSKVCSLGQAYFITPIFLHQSLPFQHLRKHLPEAPNYHLPTLAHMSRSKPQNNFFWVWDHFLLFMGKPRRYAG